MKNIDRKAVRLVIENNVDVIEATFDKNDALVTAEGTVYGTSLYVVKITPDGTTCTCQYGSHRVDASGHSHDQALRLAAQRDIENIIDDSDTLN